VRTFESFILLPLPGVIAELVARSEKRLGKSVSAWSRREHSQQAGSILSTLMRSPPVLPPVRAYLSNRDQTTPHLCHSDRREGFAVCRQHIRCKRQQIPRRLCRLGM